MHRVLQLMVLVVPYQSYHLMFWKAFVGNFLAEQLPQNNSEAVNIGELVNFVLVSDDLGRHPLISSHSFVFFLFLLLCRQTEVAELHLIPILANQHIWAFEVAV